MGNQVEQSSLIEHPWLGLLQKAQAGDEAAFNQLLTEVRPYLKEAVEKWWGKQALGTNDTSDAVQECLVTVFKQGGTVRGRTDSEFKAWLRTIARNEFLDTVHQAQRARQDLQVPLPQDSQGAVAVAADISSPSQRAMRGEEEEAREQAFQRLAPNDQLVLRLRYNEGREWPDIARQMGRSEAAVTRRFYRALRRWKQEAEATS